MKKELITGVILVAAAAVALFVFRGPSDNDFIQDKTASSAKTATKKKLEPGTKPDPGKIDTTSETEKQETSALEEQFSDAQSGIIEKAVEIEGLVKVIDDPDKPLTRVNDVEVSLNSVLPPGYLNPGEPFAEAGYNAFLDMAIDRELVVQKAYEMDIIDSEELQVMKEDLHERLTSTNRRSSQEEIDWQVDHMITSAVVNKLYEKEGLKPPRITEENVEQHYNSRSADYNWLREREAVKGTSEDKIERRVRDQIKKDLRAPLVQESREKQRVYLDTLRDQANIEYLGEKKP